MLSGLRVFAFQHHLPLPGAAGPAAGRSSRGDTAGQSPAASPLTAAVPRAGGAAPTAPAHLRLYSSRSLFTLASTL